MKQLCAVAVVCWSFFGPQFAWAKPPEEAIRAALEKNFQAINEENVKVLMATLDSKLPKRDEFEKEARAVFAETDVYMRVEEFELLAVRGPWAKARVVQRTMPKDDPADLGTERQQFYRQNSMLLPESELVEYEQVFHRSGGKWRLWLVISQPRSLSPENIMPGLSPSRSVFGGGCQTGRCRLQ